MQPEMAQVDGTEPKAGGKDENRENEQNHRHHHDEMILQQRGKVEFCMILVHDFG